MDSDEKVFGFWIYLMTDLVLFAVLFAAFVVLQGSTFGGPTGRALFDMPFALAETLILLTSSFTCSLATLTAYRAQKKACIFWFAVTCALGIAFLFLEGSEFSKFVHLGAGPERSAFLSSFFALVGTHGAHISIGLLWMGATMFRIGLRGFSAPALSQMLRAALFWHFLDVVWIFIFTVVYGMGHLT